MSTYDTIKKMIDDADFEKSLLYRLAIITKAIKNGEANDEITSVQAGELWYKLMHAAHEAEKLEA